MSAVERAAEARLPELRLAAVDGGGRAGAGRRRAGGPRGAPAGLQYRVPQQAGRGPAPAGGHAVGHPRRHQGPQRRAAGRQHARGQRVGQPAPAARGARPDQGPGEGPQARQRRTDGPAHAERPQGVLLPQAAHESRRRRRDRRHAGARRAPAARVPALLPGGRGHRPPARLHQHRRQGPGRASSWPSTTGCTACRARRRSCATGSGASSRTSRASCRRARAGTWSRPSTCASSTWPTGS